jgi:hypothetical protein
LVDYWNRLRGERAMPSRAEIDPSAIKRVLPYLMMLDVSYDPLGFRYRLVGTGIVRFNGRDFTGKAVDEANYGPAYVALHRYFAAVVETRGPIGARGRTVWIDGGEWRDAESVALPLSSDGSVIDIVLSGYVLVAKSARLPPSSGPTRTEQIEIIPAPRFTTLPDSP